MESLLMVVVVLALVLGVAMLLFAWRVLRRDRTRTDARASHLRELATADLNWSDTDDEDEDELLLADIRYQSSPPFAVAGSTHARAGWSSVILVVLVFMTVGAGSVYALYGRALPLSWPPQLGATRGEPLELLALSHRREPGGDFVVTGLVQNPTHGRTTPPLVAVAYVFDHAGEYVTAGTATLDVASLTPGDQSPFTIRVPGASAVGRFRLGFRVSEGSVFAHVDRRGAAPAGTTDALVDASR
jgi:hypothetical protein